MLTQLSQRAKRDQDMRLSQHSIYPGGERLELFVFQTQFLPICGRNPIDSLGHMCYY